MTFTLYAFLFPANATHPCLKARITQWHLQQTPMVFTKLSGPGRAPLSDLNLLQIENCVSVM